MTQGKYVELSGAQRTEVWRRWKAGESLHRIGRAFDRPHTSIHCLLAHHGGINDPFSAARFAAGFRPGASRLGIAALADAGRAFP